MFSGFDPLSSKFKSELFETLFDLVCSNAISIGLCRMQDHECRREAIRRTQWTAKEELVRFIG